MASIPIAKATNPEYQNALSHDLFAAIYGPSTPVNLWYSRIAQDLSGE